MQEVGRKYKGKWERGEAVFIAESTQEKPKKRKRPKLRAS